jgi:hypothetical protein
MKRATVAAFLFLTFLATYRVGAATTDDPPAKTDPSKKEKDAKSAPEEPRFNSPPKGVTLVVIGRLVGRITKGSDGKTFSMETESNGKKKEVEINLAAFTRVRIAKASEFDDKGNPKKSAPLPTNGTLEDLRGGMSVIVNVSGTRDGKWLVAKVATITGD